MGCHLPEDFQRFTNAGKTHNGAMITCMHKILTILNALTRDELLWKENTSNTPTFNT